MQHGVIVFHVGVQAVAQHLARCHDGCAHGGNSSGSRFHAHLQRTLRHASGLAHGVMQLVVIARRFLRAVALIFHGVGSIVAAVRQIVAFIGGLLQNLLRFFQGHVGGVGFVPYHGLRLGQRVQAALGGADLLRRVVHLRGGAVQGDAQLVSLAAVFAVCFLRRFQLGGYQLHLLALGFIDGTQLGQLVLHTGHGAGLCAESALAGFHVRI